MEKRWNGSGTYIQTLRKCGWTIALMAGVVGLTPALSKADDFNVSTGFDTSNVLIASGGISDGHWTVDQSVGGTAAAQTTYPANANWFGGWLANDANSVWIARNANVTNNGAAPYTFYDSFDLTGYDPSSASITGSWAVDDSGRLALNGTTIATLGNGAWGSLSGFSVGTGFLSGVNVLTITIDTSDQFLEAVRLQGTLSAKRSSTGTTPEPGSMALLVGLTVSGAGFAVRRRRNTGTSK